MAAIASRTPSRLRRLARTTVAVAAVALASAMAMPSPAGAAIEPGIVLKRVIGGLVRPVLVTHDGSPGRRLYIVGQRGVIWRSVFRDGAWRKPVVYMNLQSRVNDPLTDGAERGLLGLAFHPHFADNGRLYVDYTRKGTGGRKGDTVVEEYRRGADGKVRMASRRRVMLVDQPQPNHNGGNLVFGPDGYLYMGLGDGGGAGDPGENAQDLGTVLGKILRFDPRDPDGSGPQHYAIPADNPYVGLPGRDEIWSSGLRNPWRFSFDRLTGDLWIGDVGQFDREEVDHAPADGSGLGAGRGLDFGWDDCEGSREFEDDEGDGDTACSHDTLPVFDYAHGGGRCAVTGGYVYRGPDDPAWHGYYVGGDFCGRLFVLDQEGHLVLSRITSRLISSFGVDRAGRLYLTDVSGAVFQVDFRGTPPPP